MSNTDNLALPSCPSERDITNMEEEAVESQPGEAHQIGKRGKGKAVHPIWSDAFDEPDVHVRNQSKPCCLQALQNVGMALP